MTSIRQLSVYTKDDNFANLVGGTITGCGLNVLVRKSDDFFQVIKNNSSLSLATFVDARLLDYRTIVEWENYIRCLDNNFPNFIIFERYQTDVMVDCLQMGCWGANYWDPQSSLGWVKRQVLNLIRYYTKIIPQKKFGIELTSSHQLIIDGGKPISLKFEDVVILNFLLQDRLNSLNNLGRILMANNIDATHYMLNIKNLYLYLSKMLGANHEISFMSGDGLWLKY